MLNKKFVNWCLKKQLIVALLSIEAKYIALNLVAKKIMWLCLLLIKLGLL